MNQDETVKKIVQAVLDEMKEEIHRWIKDEMDIRLSILRRDIRGNIEGEINTIIRDEVEHRIHITVGVHKK